MSEQMMSKTEHDAYLAEVYAWEKRIWDFIEYEDHNGVRVEVFSKLGLADAIVRALQDEREKHDKAVEALRKIVKIVRINSENDYQLLDIKNAIGATIASIYGELPDAKT